jgi:hypothetical protein
MTYGELRSERSLSMPIIVHRLKTHSIRVLQTILKNENECCKNQPMLSFQDPSAVLARYAMANKRKLKSLIDIWKARSFPPNLLGVNADYSFYHHQWSQSPDGSVRIAQDNCTTLFRPFRYWQAYWTWASNVKHAKTKILWSLGCSQRSDPR